MQLTDLVNVARPLNEAKINAIAQRIVANYAVLTVADIHYVFNAATNGQYGIFYESLDVPKVMTWFATYFDERCRTAAEISQAEAITDKGGNFTAKYATRLLDRLQSRNSNQHK